jgi:hypothetical protein
MWIVVCKHSAFEITVEEFDNYDEAKVYYDEWSSDLYSLLKVSLSKVIESNTKR